MRKAGEGRPRVEDFAEMIYIGRVDIMEAMMIVSKWGNSLAVRLPAELVEHLSIKEGDDLEISRLDERALKLQRKPTRQELIEGLRKYQGRMPADFKFDRDEANER